MNEKDGFKVKVESSKNRAFGGDTGIDADYKYEHDQISEMVLPDEIIVESVVNVKDANYTRYYDKELGIWFCKFCEQQIVGD